VEYFANAGYEHEGLFRVSGNLRKIQDYRERFDRGENLTFPDEEDPHTVTGVFKLWLREIPDPLLTKDLYEMFIAAAAFEDEKVVISKMQKVLEFLPHNNLMILTMLFKLLKALSVKVEINKMTPENLAIIFSQCILKPRTEKTEEVVSLTIENASKANKVVVLLIKNYEHIFPAVLENIEKHKHDMQEKEPLSNNVDINISKEANGKEFVCGLVTSVKFQLDGILTIKEDHLFWKANFLGTDYQIYFKDILKVEKEKRKFVFDNGLAVFVKDNSFHFGKLEARDELFDIMQAKMHVFSK